MDEESPTPCLRLGGIDRAGELRAANTTEVE